MQRTVCDRCGVDLTGLIRYLLSHSLWVGVGYAPTVYKKDLCSRCHISLLQFLLGSKG